MLIFSVVCFEHLSVKRNVWFKNLAPKISMKFIAVFPYRIFEADTIDSEW